MYLSNFDVQERGVFSLTMLLVFVYIRVSVQFRVLVERAYDAYYSLADPQRQIQTYVFDVIRDAIPRMSLDEVFESKSSISDIVFTRLQQVMKDFGYEIVETLVANVTPNELVKYSMNEINASRRLKEATPHRGEAGTFSHHPTPLYYGG
jgi:regulator of protease activity HflC (stomatin/prohibitin superfamily)